MKVTVTIDPHFQEEDVAITGPQPSERIQKVQQFIEELDQKERLRARKEGEAFLVEPHLFHRFYIENRQVIGGKRVRPVYSHRPPLSTLSRVTTLLSTDFTI